MRKITFILLALISGTVFAQNTSSATATVNAEIVSPLTITNAEDLVFGKIVGTVAGNVRVLTNATATYSNPGMKIPANQVQPAKFTITAEEGTSFGISIPSTSLIGPGSPMAISFFHNLNDIESLAVGTTSIDLIVGGLLNVNAGQVPGDYAGTVEVTVSYE